MRKARIAIVGAGNWAQGWHMPNIAARNDAVIGAIVDSLASPISTYSQTSSLTDLSVKYGGAPCYHSIEELLADTKVAAGIDGVLCSSNHVTHYDVGMQALKAGKHLLIEKPMTVDVKEARALYEESLTRVDQGFMVNNTANWQPGTIRAHELVMAGRVGEIRHITCMFAAPLGWLFDNPDNKAWVEVTGNMKGNGFGWGQFSHTFMWLFKVTGLTPKTVYAVTSNSANTGADLFCSLTVTCTNGATIAASGVGVIPGDDKMVGNWIFGTEGVLSYSGVGGGEKAGPEVGSHGDENEHGNSDLTGADPEDPDPNLAVSAVSTTAVLNRLELKRHDGEDEMGPEFEFEHLEQTGEGPGSLDALVKACLGQPYFNGAGCLEGLKTSATIDAMYRSALSGLPEPCTDLEDFV